MELRSESKMVELTKRVSGDMHANVNTSPSGKAALPLWSRAIVVLGAFLLTTGAGVALFHPEMLVSPHDEINAAVRIYAGYFASRNLGLAIVLLIAMGLRAKETLNGLLLFTATIQMIDAVMDCIENRWVVAPGVVVLGLIFSLAAARLSGYPLWRAAAWGGSR